METLTALQARLGDIQKKALAIGVAGAVLLLIMAFVNPQQFFQSYLYGFLFWIGLSLGCLSLTMVHHLTSGRWGYGIRRYLESGFLVLPLMAVLFVPLVFGTKYLYIWTDLDLVASDPFLQKKQLYLNLPFFYVRAAIYFSIWLFLVTVLGKWALQRDKEANPKLTKRLQLFCGPAILVFALTMTFASVDWAMSLEPHWFSTMYGVLFLVGQSLAALAFCIFVGVKTNQIPSFKEKLPLNVFHDLGNMCLAAVMLWAYINFSQYLIIWMANLPEETPWYVARSKTSWQVIGLGLMLFHFAIPFLILLNRMTKRTPNMLLKVAVWLFIVRMIDLYWMIAPAFSKDGMTLKWIWLDVVALVGIGGLWIAMFCRIFSERALVPVTIDPPSDA